MNIDWTALLKVAAVSFAFGVGIVAVFSLGLLGLSQLPEPGAGEQSATAAASPGRLALAGSCFVLCAAAVLYGLWLIVPQFH
ncbi:MAG: hypothetical protein M3Y42_00185 [Actinomycetota bacterium]|nr:hypothetical protein [Actinomycetota bacterium]MDQ2955372.1 hypothetical protein [Actinomycetota bacterium]